MIHRLLPLLALALNLLLLGTALAPAHRDPKNRVFAALTAALAIWNLGVFALRTAASPEAALWWEHFVHLGIVLIPALFYHYVLVFLSARVDRILIWGYAGSALFLLLSPTPAFLRGIVDTPWGYAPDPGPLYAPFVLFFNGYLVLGVIRLLRGWRTMASSFTRNRARLVIGGVAVSLLGGVVDFARFIFGWEWIYPLGIPSNAAFALLLGVAILRYRLMDVRLLARRAALYIATTLVLSPVLLAGIALLDHVPGMERLTGGSGVVRDGLLVVCVVGAALPLLTRLQRALDRFMFSRRHGVRDALLALSHELPQVLHRQRLADTLTRSLVDRIPALHAVLHVWDDDLREYAPLSRATSDAARPGEAEASITPAVATWLRMTGRTLRVAETMFYGDALPGVRSAIAGLDRDHIALVVPLFLDGGLAAVLTVGDKRSGEVYEVDEVELLEMLVRAAGVALTNSTLYADLQARMEQLQVTQDQLMQAAKMAAIGELSASIAHDINNPLMVIIGSVSLMQRQRDPARERERLSTIESQALRAANIVRGLLDFARRRERSLTPVSVHEVIERSLTLVEGKLMAHGVVARTHLDAHPPTVLGDRDELTQVFVNLASNAADAMRAGGTLTIGTESRYDAGVEYLSIRVSDTGSGIAAEHLPHIFDPFFTTKAEGQGTGLGLSITQSIVKRHEGTIEVESTPGRGTTFTINLPPVADEADSRILPA